jgi:uncharacterized protein (TIGR02266 family)
MLERETQNKRPSTGAPASGPVIKEDLRSSERVKLVTEVRIDSESQFFAGVTGNVGGGGLFVATYAILPVGTPVTVEFTLPGEPAPTICASGSVCWLRETEGAVHGMGVTFDDLSTEDKKAIREFCKVRPPLLHDMQDRVSDPDLVIPLATRVG